MIIQHKDEDRINYLMRVLNFFMETTIAGEETIDYDGVTCDGSCLAEDIVNEIGLDWDYER